MATAPFVRQFAHTDAPWFAAQPWPMLQAWLARFEASALFEAVMGKHELWQAIDAQTEN
jgi:glutathione S-transferase